LIDGEILNFDELIAEADADVFAWTVGINVGSDNVSRPAIHPGDTIVMKLVGAELAKTQNGAKNRRYCENQQQGTSELVFCLAQRRTFGFTRSQRADQPLTEAQTAQEYTYIALW
jgi:hypothetical protein